MTDSLGVTASRWIRRSSLAIVDQAVFAGTSLVLSVMLAHQLTPADFGAFVFSYSVFTFVGNLHIALLADPAVVFGSGRYAKYFRSYLTSLIRLHFLVTSSVAVVLLILGVAVAQFTVLTGWAIVGAGVATPTILLSWLLRRAVYVQANILWSVLAGLLYLALTIAGVVLLKLQSGVYAMLVLAGAAIPASLILLHALRPEQSHDSGAPTDRAVRVQHWQYAHWSLPAAALNWLMDNAFYVILPIWHGLTASAELRVLMLLALPVVNALGILGMSLLPALSRAHSEGDVVRLERLVNRAILSLGAACLVYGLLVITRGRQIIVFAFPGGYEPTSIEIVLLAILPFPVAIHGVFGHALRATEQFKSVFLSFLIGAVSVVAASPILVAKLGVTGALGSTLLAWTTSGIAMAVMHFRSTAGYSGRT